ncbi:PIN domain nuclease [bacterium]|nr:PIN domain nuclease [bacterium]
MVIVDTTVWIDFFRDCQKPHVSVLESFIRQKENLCICGIILTEVLQGIREKRDYEKTKNLFDKLIFLPMTHTTFIKSAEIYRLLRSRGITVRKPVDCMIASVAIEHKIPLLHNDRDFDPIEKHCGLKSVKTYD